MSAIAQKNRKQLQMPEGGMRIRAEKRQYNSETLAAMQEARDIMSGKIEAKSYGSSEELMKEILAEMYAEEMKYTEG